MACRGTALLYFTSYWCCYLGFHILTDDILLCSFQLKYIYIHTHTWYTVSMGGLVAKSVLTTDWTNRVRSPGEVMDFSSSLYVQNGYAAHPAPYPMGTAGPSSGVKRGRGVTLTPHPDPMSWWRTNRSCNSSLTWLFHLVSGTALFNLYLQHNFFVYMCLNKLFVCM
jgi:hypothetical protein